MTDIRNSMDSMAEAKENSSLHTHSLRGPLPGLCSSPFPHSVHEEATVCSPHVTEEDLFSVRGDSLGLLPCQALQRSVLA